jgi:hypothetical protein
MSIFDWDELFCFGCGEEEEKARARIIHKRNVHRLIVLSLFESAESAAHDLPLFDDLLNNGSSKVVQSWSGRIYSDQLDGWRLGGSESPYLLICVSVC